MAMPVWTTACPDWEQRIVEGKSLIPFSPLYPDRANKALEVFKKFRIADLARQPTVEEVTKQWVFDLVAAIFGAYNEETGVQHIKEILLLICKKNTKSTLAALIMLAVMLFNWRHSAEFAIIAPTKEIAGNSYKPLRDSIKADEELSSLFTIQDHTRTITHLPTGSTLKIIAADSDAVGGGKYTVVLIDELWLFGKTPKANGMLLEATGGLLSRQEGFVIDLTTQSDEPPAGVFKEKLSYARKVRDGEIEDKHFLPILYEFPQSYIDSEDCYKEENYHIVNPNLGASVDVPTLNRILAQAAEGSEGDTLQKARAKHLNIEIGLNLRSNRWAGADSWESRGNKKVTFEYLLEHAEVIDVGCDGGGLDDLLGSAFVGRDKDTREWLVYTKAWAHPSVLERRKEIAPRLHDFAKDGDLVLVNQVGEDVEEFAEMVAEVHRVGLLDKVGVDQAGIGAILDALIVEEIPEEKVVGISQGWRMSGAIKTTERKLAEGVLIHSGQPMMAWCVSNAKVEPRGNAIIITKQISGSAKIDPLMALFNAVSLMALNPEAKVRDMDIKTMMRSPIII